MSKIKCLTEGIPFSVVWRCQLLCSYIVQFRRAKTESGKLFYFDLYLLVQSIQYGNLASKG
jgi:hypothetical protein